MIGPGDVGVLGGSLKTPSRTLELAVQLVETLGDPSPFVVDLGQSCAPDGSIDARGFAAAAERLLERRVLVIASPTYKASFTGLLKHFLDLLPAGALSGHLALPVMTGADDRHALAAELLLRPALVELGATCPVPALYVADPAVPTGERCARWVALVRAVASAKHTGGAT